MGKQVKGWVPPTDDEIIDPKSTWAPPADDEIVETVKKKGDPAPVTPSAEFSGSSEPAKPSAESGARPTPTTRQETPNERLIGRINNHVIVSKNAFNQEAEKKRAELQSLVNADPSKVDQANEEFKNFLTERPDKLLQMGVHCIARRL